LKRARPAPRLRIEREFEVVDANRAELRAAEVEQLLALGWAFAGQEVHLARVESPAVTLFD
jgi:hypothetical protein